VIAELDARRQALQQSVGSIAQASRHLSAVVDDIDPALNQLITREPGFAKHMVDI
jgi:phospholipid/cholesterol/gamma-HCH transport system substrate-binding protein